MKIRSTIHQDLPELKQVLDETELFPSEMLEDMVTGHLSDAPSDDVWLTCELDESAIGFCYAVPEQLADCAWNMLAIAVLPAKQGCGAGAALTKTLEDRLREDGQRILIADTSGTEDFDQTRAFYRKNGYIEEARIRDFWAKGDDKVTFLKALA